MVTNSMWTWKSQRDKKIVYKINLLQSLCCHDSCHLKCPYMDCNSLCRHTYTCECLDYANGHICKHLHGLHIWLGSHGNSSPIDDHHDTSKVMEHSLHVYVYGGINTAVPGSSEGVNLSVTIGSQSAPENGITPHNEPTCMNKSENGITPHNEPTCMNKYIHIQVMRL